MIKLIICGLLIALAVIIVILGLVNYSTRYSDTPDKDNFSFLNQFPYELQDNPTMKYNLYFKIVASLFGAAFATFGMYIFFFADPYAGKTITEIILGIIFIILGIILFGEFSITLKNYRLHLITTSSLFAFTVCNFLLYGYYILAEAELLYSSVLAYILFALAAILLASLIFTPLKKWMYLEKEEKDGSIHYYRKRISILPLMEWIFILANILMVFLITIL